MKTWKLYNGEVELAFDEKNHLYRANGKPVGGVTSVLSKAVNKPALIWWSANKASEYWKEKIIPGKTYDEVELDTIHADARKAHRSQSRLAASKGILIHEWAEKYIKGESPPIPINVQLREATEKVAKFLDEYKIEPQLVERPVFSRELNVAGTPDVIGTFKNQLAVVDWKTGKGIYEEALLQEGCYAQAYLEEFNELPKWLVVVNASVEGHLSVFATNEVERYIDGYKSALKLAEVLDFAKAELETNTIHL